jgi:predicted transcriptional regulator
MPARKQPRDQVSARLDPDVLEVVQHVAEVERRPISSVVRNVLADWAKGRETQTDRKELA